MRIVSFDRTHVPQAAVLAAAAYAQERAQVPALPPVKDFPDLAPFAGNGFSFAALEGSALIGFLCFYPPRDNAFTTHARGSFSPIHAHGAIGNDPGGVHQRLYQAAAQRLVEAGAASHSVGLYAHDHAALEAFFRYGFGLRCVDAIRPMTPLHCPAAPGYDFAELPVEQRQLLLPMKNALIAHLGRSPAFMRFAPRTREDLEAEYARRKPRYFCAYQNGRPAAFLELIDWGENFACAQPGMKNICGAYCMQEHRGRGVAQGLLDFTIRTLQEEGYCSLGVDFESFNPTALGFWLKYFTAYTHSVVRRIDESALDD